MNGLMKSAADASFSERFAGQKIPVHEQTIQVLSRRGIIGLFLFLLVSSLFFTLRDIDLLAPLAESARVILGCPPPPDLATLALAGYTLSAMVLVLARIMTGARPSLKWVHLGYRTVFYIFYAVSNSLAENFMGVFVAGLVLIGLEQLNIWTHSLKILPRQKALPGRS